MSRTNEQIKSKVLNDFVEEIKFRNRNPDPRKSEVLKMLGDFETNYEIELIPGNYMYRSRIISNRNDLKDDTGHGFYGYNKNESGAPPREKAIDLRANYRYIPCLYCSKNPFISILECHPRVGSYVSVAKIEIKNNIKLLDFSQSQSSKKKISEEKKELFEKISELFSTPVANDDDTIDYIPTQFIAEYAKKIGYDGIVYKSSVGKSIIDDFKKADQNIEKHFGYDVAIFNYENNAEPISSNVFEISWLTGDFKRDDQDPNGIEVIDPIEFLLGKI